MDIMIYELKDAPKFVERRLRRNEGEGEPEGGKRVAAVAEEINLNIYEERVEEGRPISMQASTVSTRTSAI
eukprot:11376339-Heterocapsa_arctica.AAC.1